MPQFEVEMLDQYADRFAIDVSYYSGSMCTCLAKNNGHPDPACGKCTLGWVYAAPVTAEVIRTDPNIRGLPQEIATLFVGGARLTIMEKKRDNAINLAFANVHRGDVFVVPDYPERGSDILRRGTRDVIWAFEVSSIVLIRDEDDMVYVESTDFTFSGRTITWLAGMGPASGKYYTVEFVAPSQYIIYGNEPVHRGGDNTGAVLPKKVRAVRRHYQQPTESHPLNPYSKVYELET